MNIINYIKGAIVFAITLFAYSFGATKTKNKELEKEKRRNDKTISNIKKAKNVLGYDPKLDFTEGVNKTIEAWRS